MPAPRLSSLEPLEARIAPATLVLTSATNGNETITITSSQGSMASLLSAVSSAGLTGTNFAGDHLDFSLDLSGHAVFDGTALSFAAGGGATFFLQELDASGLHLGAVAIGGDAGMIVAGANDATSAIQSLKVASLGGPAALHSTLKGALGSLKIDGDLLGTLELTGSFGSLGKGVVTGALEGGATAESGSLITSRSIGSLMLQGDISGGAGERSGGIYSGGNIGQLSLGSLLGGSGRLSGEVSALGSIGTLNLAGSVTGNSGAGSAAENGRVVAGGYLFAATISGQVTGGVADSSGSVVAKLGLGTVSVLGGISGGAGLESGSVGSSGPIGSVTVGTVPFSTGGILAGGSGERSGTILGSGSIGRVTVNGDILGGSGKNSGDIAAGGALKHVFLKGDLTGGSGEESGAIGSSGPLGKVELGALSGGVGLHSGRIVSASTLGSVTVAGDVRGGDGDESGAIGALRSLGSVMIEGQLVGGSGQSSGSVLGGRGIGSVTVGSTVVGGAGAGSGSIVAQGFLSSVTLHSSLNGRLGNFDSAQIHSSTGIGSVVIDGSVIGGDNYGAGSVFANGPIGSASIGGDLDGGGTSDSGTYGGSLYTIPAYRQQGEGSVPIVNPLGYRIGNVVIGDSLVGGAGFLSGGISSYTSIGKVTVGAVRQEVRGPRPHATGPVSNPDSPAGLVGGESGRQSGSIIAGDDIDFVSVTGGLIGGGAFQSGSILSDGQITRVEISGDVAGGSGDESGSLVGASLKAVHIGGNLSGEGHESGSLIAVQKDIGTVVVNGTISSDDDGDGPLLIAARRNLGSVSAFAIVGGFEEKVVIAAGGRGSAQTAADAVAIGSVTTSEQMSSTDILAGYVIPESTDQSGLVDGFQGINGHVSVGTVEVGTDNELTAPWIGNNIFAGVTDSGSGSVDLTGGNHHLPSVIAKILVHGGIGGNSANGGGGFYVIADEIKAVTVSGVPLALHAGPGNDEGQLDPATQTTFYFEIGSNTGSP